MVDKKRRIAPDKVLATDLDGTLIPLEGSEQNVADLRTLDQQVVERDVTLVFVTGRHSQSVIRAIDEYALPQPDCTICDVGTSLFERQPSGELVGVDAYQQHLSEIIAVRPIHELREQLSTIRGLRLQEEEKQGRFKLSYYADAAEVKRLVQSIQESMNQLGAPYAIIHSVDPFSGDGLIDLLPCGVSKAHALAWW